MASLRIRPKIRCVSPLSTEEIIDRFEQVARKYQGRIIVRKRRDHIEMHIREADRHYWSPVLNVIFDKADGGTIVRGRFGPEPQVWTMFMFFYFAALSFVFFSGMWVLVQLQVGHAPKALPYFLTSLVVLALVFIAAQVGQRKGHDQTVLLQQFCREVLGKEELEKLKIKN